MLTKIEQRYPYQGLQLWGLSCSLMFIVSQLFWVVARVFRSVDWLEIPLRIFYFPLAPVFDRSNWMIHDPNIYFCALSFWIVIFFAGLLLSARRVNPIVPAIGIVFLTSVSGIAYELLTKPKWVIWID